MPSTAACRDLLHECRTWLPAARTIPFGRPPKRGNDFADKALREGLPWRPLYDRNQSEYRRLFAKSHKGTRIAAQFCPSHQAHLTTLGPKDGLETTTMDADPGDGAEPRLPAPLQESRRSLRQDRNFGGCRRGSPPGRTAQRQRHPLPAERQRLSRRASRPKGRAPHQLSPSPRLTDAAADPCCGGELYCFARLDFIPISIYSYRRPAHSRASSRGVLMMELDAAPAGGARNPAPGRPWVAVRPHYGGLP